MNRLDILRGTATLFIRKRPCSCDRFAGFDGFFHGLADWAKPKKADINQPLTTQDGRIHELCYADRFAAYIKLGTVMSLGGIFLIREPLLRGVAIGAGAFFVGVAAVILFTHPWQAGESRLVLLIPFLSGALLLAIATVLRGNAMRSALVLFFAIPAVVFLLLKLTCEVGIFSGGICV